MSIRRILALILAADRVTAYLAARRDAEARHEQLEDVVRESTPELEAALRELAQLTAVNVADAERATANARRWDRLSNAMDPGGGAATSVPAVSSRERTA